MVRLVRRLYNLSNLRSPLVTYHDDDDGEKDEECRYGRCNKQVKGHIKWSPRWARRKSDSSREELKASFSLSHKEE